ncbi:hypothetical protein KCP76_12215 [Salmonella enterica subsp. enterica serovar Weltevreden]|nr:hypothetical protein KCP76_12215 [Salmonella enterica subsp. enterica serovar Weltevreden]
MPTADAENTAKLCCCVRKQAFDPENRRHFGGVAVLCALYTRRFAVSGSFLRRAIEYLLAKSRGTGQHHRNGRSSHYSMEEMLQLDAHCSIRNATALMKRRVIMPTG